MRSTFLPYALPLIGEEEIAEVVDSLKSGWLTTGPKTKRFEQDFREYIGSRNAIAVNSCTAALHIALTALGVEPGDEVIVPTLTFCSTANVVVHLGAKPVLVDVREDFCIDPAALEGAITSRTKAIVPVHFSGQACDLDAVYRIAFEHNLPIVEDAAHAVGTTYHGKKIGADDFGPKGIRRITAFSFYAIKNMTTGEGGMITTADSALAERMRLLSLHGMSHDAWKRYGSSGAWYYEVVSAGYKSNMSDIQSAIGIHQLRRLDGFLGIRQKYAAIYDEAFAEIPEIQIPIKHQDRNHAYHLYVIRLVLEHLKVDRAEFITQLNSLNIGTSVHFIPVHLHPFYREKFGYQLGQLPIAEGLYSRIVSLPLYPKMSEDDLRDVIASVKKLISTNRKEGGPCAGRVSCPDD